MQDTQAQFDKFLSKTLSQKEVSLVIAKNKEEMAEFEKMLSEGGFQKLETIFNFFVVDKPNKVYLNLDDNFSKEIYDFSVQYPSGQVELFDSEQMESKVISPTYENSAVVFLVSKDALRKIESKGYDIRSVVGGAHQS